MWTLREIESEHGITVLHDGPVFIGAGQEVYVERWPLEKVKKGVQMKEFLAGKKTIIVQILAIAGILGAWWSGEMVALDALGAIWAALTITFGAVKINRMTNGS